MDSLLNTATLTELQEILGDDLLSITELFATQVVDESAALTQQIQAQNLEGIARHAHAMKGSCGNVGAMALSQWAASLEKAAKAGDANYGLSSVDALPALVENTLAAMREQGFLKG